MGEKKPFGFLKNWRENIKDPVTALETGGAILTGGFLTAMLGLTGIGGLLKEHYFLGVSYSLLAIFNLLWYTYSATKSISGNLNKEKASK